MTDTRLVGLGRPTLLTGEVADILCEAVEHVVPRRAACRLAGVCVSTLYVWLARGRSGEEPYAAFMDRFHAAERRGEMATLSVVSEAMAQAEP